MLDAAELGRSAERMSERVGDDGRRASAAARSGARRVDGRLRRLASMHPLMAFGVAIAVGYVLGCARRR